MMNPMELLTGYSLFFGVYFIQHVTPNSAIELQNRDEPSFKFQAGNEQHAKILENRTEEAQHFCASKDIEKNASTINNDQRKFSNFHQKQNGGRDAFANGNLSAEENDRDFHNLSVLEYLEKFNASNIQDRNEIADYFAFQSHSMEDPDASERRRRRDLNETFDEAVTSKDFTSRPPIIDKNEHLVDIRDQLEKEFLEHHQRSKGQWDLLAKCTTHQRIELCKDAHRRIIRDDHKKDFHIADQQFQPMEVIIVGTEPLTTQLLKCSVNSPVVKWNGLAFSANNVFYLGEGSFPTEVFKLSPAPNNDEVYVEGKITRINYPQKLD